MAREVDPAPFGDRDPLLLEERPLDRERRRPLRKGEGARRPDHPVPRNVAPLGKGVEGVADEPRLTG
jgi:hypothetical protein